MKEIGRTAEAEKKRKALEQDVERFLKAGGKIRQCPIGQTTENKKLFSSGGGTK